MNNDETTTTTAPTAGAWGGTAAQPGTAFGGRPWGPAAAGPGSPPGAGASPYRPAGFPAGPAAPAYSAWWKRVAATLIDAVLFVAVSAVVTFPLFSTATSSAATGHAGVSAWFVPLVTLLILVGDLVYHIVLEGGSRGATVGKMALGIQVRDAATLGPIGYGRAAARRLVAMLLWWVMWVPGIVDVLFPLWDPRRQTLHDKAVSSVVVDRA